MDSLPDELVERLIFFPRRDSDLQQLMAMHAVSRRLKRLLLAWPEQVLLALLWRGPAKAGMFFRRVA